MPSSLTTLALVDAAVLALAGAAWYVVVPILVVATLYEFVLTWLTTNT